MTDYFTACEKDAAIEQVQQWENDTKRLFNILMKQKKKDLVHVGAMAGLDMSYYKTKNLIAKGLMIRLCSPLPISFKDL